MTEFLTTKLNNPKARLLLAHGAGAQMTSPFLEKIAQLLSDRDIEVSRFEFSYMAQRRTGGKRRPPPRAERLVEEYISAVNELREAMKPHDMLLIGGKSMGGRVASMVADDLYAQRKIQGLVCLGYPFHPPGKAENLRTAHLADLKCPTLIVQGERDPFGSRDEVEGYQLSKNIKITWAGDGDHDLGPRGGKGYTKTGNLTAAADEIASFVSALSA
jgi:predicted alpha/beta-hydrolase family hydrolase